MKNKSNNIQKLIGLKIKSIRTTRNISLTNLAQTLGISRYQLQNYEQGLSDIKIARLYDIAKTIGIDINYFFENNSVQNRLNDTAFNLLPKLNNIKDIKIKKSIYGLIDELSKS